MEPTCPLSTMIVPSRSRRTPCLPPNLLMSRPPSSQSSFAQLWFSLMCPPVRPSGERAPPVLVVRRRSPLGRCHPPLRVNHREGPRPHVGVAVPAVLLVERDRSLDPVALIRRPA